MDDPFSDDHALWLWRALLVRDAEGRVVGCRAFATVADS